MATVTTTTIDQGTVILSGAVHRDDTLTFPATTTYAEGTILARQIVNTAVTASAFTGTGDGTVTLATVQPGPIVPLVGAYVLTCTAAATNGGTFKLEDPNGALVSADLVLTVGAGAATVFNVGGLEFTITDGATDFAVNDTATLTVAANGNLVAYSKTGAGGAQFPISVLTNSETGDSETKYARPMVAGEVKKERLIIAADGDASNVDAIVIDQLIAAGIVPVDVQQLSDL